MLNFLTVKGLQTFLVGLRNIFISKEDAKTYLKTVEETDAGIVFKDGNGNIICTFDLKDSGATCTCACKSSNNSSDNGDNIGTLTIATNSEAREMLDDIFKKI